MMPIICHCERFLRSSLLLLGVLTHIFCIQMRDGNRQASAASSGLGMESTVTTPVPYPALVVCLPRIASNGLFYLVGSVFKRFDAAFADKA